MFQNIDIKKLDILLTEKMNHFGIIFLRYSVALIFIWFGLLKTFEISPAQELVANTVYWFENKSGFVIFLGWWEVLIGLTMLYKPMIRLSLLLLIFQMPGTFLPLVLLPEVCFTYFPIGLTLEGQYIFKNLIIISAALTIAGSIRKAQIDKNK